VHIIRLVRENGTKEEFTFESHKLALIYKEYHLEFGTWNKAAHWVEDTKITPDTRPFICDEMTEVRGGEIVRLYRITEGFKIELEEVKAPSLALDEVWERFRYLRTEMLKLTDWSQLADVVMSQDLRKQYRSYRQYLRDLPKLHSDSTIIHAKVYDFNEFLNGKR
jgi:Phage tail assembly chaperone protein